MINEIIFKIDDKELIFIKGDIIKIPVDAIVNAANKKLRGGGGVDGAIHREGGPEIMEDCKKYSECPTGEAVITRAGRLPAKYIIHTVGPIWKGGKNNEEILLAKAYTNSLKLAENHQLNTISFPAISTGIYGFPVEKASEIAISTIAEFLKTHSLPKKVICVLFSNYDFSVYQETLKILEKTLKK